MKYEHIVPGTFISRPNRFIAHVSIRRGDSDREETVVCHVKNTGRCRELLLPGAAVLLQFHPEAAALGRKTEYSLIGVYKERDGEHLLINMDSQAPNQVAAEWLDTTPLSPYTLKHIRREVTYGQSRFDLAFDLVSDAEKRPAFMEVKGVTLEEDDVAKFPDAPTERGVKHIMELAEAAKAGYEAYILFVIQMKGIREFTPNRKTHPQFGDALCLAEKAGVHILARDCVVTKDSLSIDAPVPVRLL